MLNLILNRSFFLIVLLASVFVFFIKPASADSGIIAELAGVNEDRASTQGTFGPGPGFSGKLRNDYHWTVTLTLDQPKIISSILIEHAVAGEAWTTSSRRRYGKDLYPIVVHQNGGQLNHKYDASLGPFGPGEVTLDLFGQIESTPFAGGSIVFEFTDQSFLKTSIPSSTLDPEPLDVSQLNCEDSDGGASYDIQGTITYNVGDSETHTYSDYCLSDKIVAEGMCGGLDRQARQFVISHGVCSGVCDQGACVGGENKSDFEGSIRSTSEGLEFSFQTGRQRSIEYIMVTGDEESDVSEFLSNVFYQGEGLTMGNGGDSYVFEPGSHTITIVPNQEADDFSAGKLRIVFTDGTRFVQEIGPSRF